MKLVFFLEERSMKELLDGILPRILPDGILFQTIPHQGKSDLEKSLPIKLKGWNEPRTKFVVVHDQDSNNCVKLKQKLTDICTGYGKEVLIRIPCHELEAWYWSDLAAVDKAFGKDTSELARKRKYSIPDKITNPKQELKRHFPGMGQIDSARKIAPYMNISENTSHSFQIFVQGVLAFCAERQGR
ncbi:MAG: DUF4276 family protein [Desulfovibrio sp.]|nr:DUF4276 family protein [Desulfovibrio sp.]